MSFHRVTLVALATLFTVGMTSLASAGCCDWGYSAPVNYGCGGCGGCGVYGADLRRPRYHAGGAGQLSAWCGGCGRAGL